MGQQLFRRDEEEDRQGTWYNGIPKAHMEQKKAHNTEQAQDSNNLCLQRTSIRLGNMNF